MRDEVRPPRAKLTRAQVREIRRTLEYEPISYAALARHHGVSAPTIAQIAHSPATLTRVRPKRGAQGTTGRSVCGLWPYGYVHSQNRQVIFWSASASAS